MGRYGELYARQVRNPNPNPSPSPSPNPNQVREARVRQAELQGVIDKLRREAEERERVLAEREQRFVTLRDENLRLEACREVLTFRVHELEI